MKKRIFMLLMAMVMMLGLSITSLAAVDDWEDGTFLGEYYIDFYYTDSDMNYGFNDAITLEYKDKALDGNIITDHGDIISWIASDPYESEEGKQLRFSNIIFQVNGEVVDVYGPQIDKRNNMRSIKFSCSGGNDTYSMSLSMGLGEVETPTEPEAQTLSTIFSGCTVSSSNECEVAVSGYISGEFVNGVNTINSADIANQTITVILHNISTDEVIVRREPSITGLEVTVSNGAITSITITGNAKTPNGSADTYTTTITP